MSETAKPGLLKIIGPGILVAATGVGAGDLATGAFTGNKLGVAILWAVLVGAALKFVLNEGLARWQLATGNTLLEGCVEHFGPAVQAFFMAYLLCWSFFVGSALMAATGVTVHAMFPVFEEAATGKIVFGILHSVVGVVLARVGGYRLFEKVMSGCIAVMFVTVVVTAIALAPSWTQIAAGLVLPRIPDFAEQGGSWTIALMGGVGGTLTVLCYGYWIREEGRRGAGHLRTCRIDLGVAYAMTAVFGIAIVIIGSTVEIEGKGAGLVVALANKLEGPLGKIGRWAFLIGAWGAVTSSLLGVWQSVPYLFADYWNMLRSRYGSTDRAAVDPHSPAYQVYQFALATIPAIGLWTNFERAQKLYAIVGAAFMPMLAAALLYLNGPARLVDEKHRNRLLTSIVLAAALVFFIVAGFLEVHKAFSVRAAIDTKPVGQAVGQASACRGGREATGDGGEATRSCRGVRSLPAKQMQVNVLWSGGRLKPALRHSPTSLPYVIIQPFRETRCPLVC